MLPAVWDKHYLKVSPQLNQPQPERTGRAVYEARLGYPERSRRLQWCDTCPTTSFRRGRTSSLTSGEAVYSIGRRHYSPAFFKIKSSSRSVNLKFVVLIFARIGLTDGIIPASFASTIIPTVPIIVNPNS